MMSRSRQTQIVPQPAPNPTERQNNGASSQVQMPQQGLAHHLRRALVQYPLPSSTILLLLVSGVFWLSGQHAMAQWVLIGIILLGGIPLLWEMLSQMFHKVFSIDIIAILAISGSLWLGEYLAGAIIVLMLSGGKALEAYALRKAQSSLSTLAERAPRTAHIWHGEQLIDVPADTVEIGGIVVVKPGEVIPIDGVVLEGSASVSEADLTGEPVPVRKTPGMVVFSGSNTLDGMLTVRASKRSSDSKYAQIVHLVKEAQEHKAPIHRLADRYSIVFTFVTLIVASAAWFFSRDAVNALAVLVVATPCPLILATPIAIMSGIDSTARRAIIVKSGAAVEQLGEVDVAVFDKTGTLTLGIPRVTGLVLVEDLTGEERRQREDELLAITASVEQLSSHVLARAVVDAAQERQLRLYPASDFEEIFGKGIRGCVPVACQSTQEEHPELTDEKFSCEVAIGNRTFMRQMGIALPPELVAEREQRKARGQIGSFVALDGEVKGLLVLEDVPRADLPRLTRDLKAQGVRQTVLLTGDSEEVAQQIGKLAGVDRIVAHCLPEEKVRVVRELVQSGHRVLMVGDGVNDAPALAAATVGIALGAQGLTAAASVADAVLLSTDILRVVSAVRIGRHVMRVARQGIWIGMGLSAIAMLFAAYGYIIPALGAILQEGIDVLVILNALRAAQIGKDPV